MKIKKNKAFIKYYIKVLHIVKKVWKIGSDIINGKAGMRKSNFYMTNK